MTYPIEKGVPIPGDSFFVPGAKVGLSGATNRAAKRYGYRFVVRSFGGGVRVWRVA